MYGIRDCLAFGEPMSGYLPDSFSMSSPAAAHLQRFWHPRAPCSGAGVPDGTVPINQFLWQSQDGNEVTAQVLPLNYAIGD